MKQLTDKVFDQVRLACEYAALDRPTLCGPALDALDSAQPVQVNAMLVEALNRLLNADNDPYLTAQGVRNLARAALTAAQQAQPERAPLTPDVVRALWMQTLEATKGPLPIEEFASVLAAHYGIKQGGQHD